MLTTVPLRPDTEDMLTTAQLVKLHDDNIRQNITCLLTTLAAGVKLGTEFAPEILYAVPGEINRGLIEQKLMEFIKNL